MKIGICDDILEYCNSIESYVEDYFNMSNAKYEVYKFISGNDFLNSNMNFDILFLDIELEYINGIEVAEKVLEISPNTIIIVVEKKKVVVF